jgi:Zn-dependent protease
MCPLSLCVQKKLCALYTYVFKKNTIFAQKNGMKYTVQIARIAGIPILLHWSFALLLVFPAYLHKVRHAPPKTILLFVLFILSLFVCVLLHELGHSLAARYYKIKTKDIILLPVGGMARLENTFQNPMQEAVVAIAGPLVNLFLFLLISVLILIFYGFKLTFIESLTVQPDAIGTNLNLHLWVVLLQANGALAIFNMFPAFPMDGSRVFRALAATQMNKRRATRLAAGVSYAVILILLVHSTGLWHYFKTGSFKIEWLLVGFSFYLWQATRKEYQQVVLDELLKRHTVANVLRTQYTTFQMSDPMYMPITALTKGIESDFIVVEGEEIKGILSREAIIEASNQKLAALPIADFLAKQELKINEPVYQTASKQEDIKTIYIKMTETEQYLVPIFDESKSTNCIESLLGVVDMNMIQNYIKIQKQLH